MKKLPNMRLKLAAPVVNKSGGRREARCCRIPFVNTSPRRRSLSAIRWAAVMFSSQAQAKRFFVEKIVGQATREGRPLSENERWMLSYSESDPEFVVDLARVHALESEIPDAEYERKVAGLAERACMTDIASDPDALATYQDALQILSQGDHYILVMLKQGLSRRLRPWWAFWR